MLERGHYFTKRTKENACHRHYYWASYCETCRANLLKELTVDETGAVQENHA